MIEDIITGIAAAIAEAFPETEIYKEELKQGFKEPCFFITLIDPVKEPFIKKRYRRKHLFSIQYFPKSETNARAECYRVLEVLLEKLEYITVNGDLVRGTKMKTAIADGVLTVLVNYNIFTKRIPELDIMEDLTIKNYAR